MPKIPFLVLLCGFLLHSCSDGSSSSDGGDDGTSQNGDRGGVAIECTRLGDPCPDELECLCCGSIGPSEICICTTACDSEDDCDDPDRPTCNKPNLAGAGICTPDGYNCCWECQ